MSLAPLPQIFLPSGELHVGAAPIRISTVLGSCVAVCLWDARRRWGGMNHFILPRAPAGDCTARYGDIAIPQLIARMNAAGSPRRDLVAKVFGGARVLPSGAPYAATIGQQNADLAFRMLTEAGLPVVGQSIGGEEGIVIYFDIDSGDVLLRRVNPRRAKVA